MMLPIRAARRSGFRSLCPLRGILQEVFAACNLE
jgi:hypothetical protein